MKSILAQCIMKGAKVYIADFKGGLDFSKVWHTKAEIITDVNRFLEILDKVFLSLENV